MNDFYEKILPNEQTDHGRFNLADLIVLIVDLILLGYTCYRSWRFLDASFAGAGSQSEYAVMAIVGLVGLDIGAIAWSLVWMYGSTTMWQDAASLVMFVVDVLGMVLTSMVDSLTAANEVPVPLRVAALYGVPAIILLNVIVGIIYHMISPQVSLSRKKRQMQANLHKQKELGELAQRENALKIDLASKLFKQREAIIQQQRRLAAQKIDLDGIELGVSQALADDEPVRRKGEAVRDEISRRAAQVQPPARETDTAPLVSTRGNAEQAFDTPITDPTKPAEPSPQPADMIKDLIGRLGALVSSQNGQGSDPK